MIVYFSATGNCKDIATKIAEELNDEAVFICEFTNEQKNRINQKQEYIGIVTPTYVYGLPNIIADFISNTKINADAYKFIIAAYGTSPGLTWYYADKFLKKSSNAVFDAKFSIFTNDNYTPWFDVSDKEKVEKNNQRTEQELAVILSKIKNRDTGNFMKKKFPRIGAPICRIAYNFICKTKHLSADEKCIGCGICKNKCPVHAIELNDGKPVWTKDKCEMCLGCLHRCPQFSIQFGNGNATRKHGQYQNPNVKI